MTHPPSGLTKAVWTDEDFPVAPGRALVRPPAAGSRVPAVLRTPPRHGARQVLTLTERGGISFAERSFA
ncbi:hypothetical protein GCM10027258_53520 [Amycolatopsis stemonae]